MNLERVMSLVVLAAMAWPAAALEDGPVMDVGRRGAALKDGAIGRLETTSLSSLRFESAGGKLEIPFAKIDSYHYSQEVARHLGVLPAIAVGLIRKRQQKHFVRIAFHDESNAPQVAGVRNPEADAEDAIGDPPSTRAATVPADDRRKVQPGTRFAVAPDGSRPKPARYAMKSRLLPGARCKSSVGAQKDAVGRAGDPR